jgi:hypothetical protein
MNLRFGLDLSEELHTSLDMGGLNSLCILTDTDGATIDESLLIDDLGDYLITSDGFSLTAFATA